MTRLGLTPFTSLFVGGGHSENVFEISMRMNKDRLCLEIVFNNIFLIFRKKKYMFNKKNGFYFILLKT